MAQEESSAATTQHRLAAEPRQQTPCVALKLT
jgi:hypothetical protein